MIDYAYPDIFTGTAVQKELLITDGTVTVTDDEYTVTDDTITFETGDLETESFELSQGLMSEMQFTYGCCETGKVRFIARKHYVNSIKGVELKVYIIPEHDASKMLQLGVFKVYEDKQSDNYNLHSVTAYDAMYDILNADVTDWYNTVLPSENSTETLENFRTSFTTHFGLTTESASEPLYNDDLIIHRTIEKDQISGAEIIKAICEINGCFGIINNVGEFRYKGLPQSIIHDASTLELDVPDYMDIQFEETSFKAIKKVKIVNENVTATSSQAATGNFNTYTIAYNPLIADYSQAQLQSLADDLCDLFYNHSYLPCAINAIGNPVHEVGDCLIVNTKYGFGVLTYIFERTLKGIQALRDTYRSNGVEYLSDNLNKQSTQTKAVQSQVSQMAQTYANSDTDFVETIRNIGFRLLDEPINVSIEFNGTDFQNELNWTDPDDISTLEPVPCTWAGTVVVRNKERVPRHRWDGTLIVDSTTKDEYSSNALVDVGIAPLTTYNYGIFPYHVALDDLSNPIKHYRYTKVVTVTTGNADTEQTFLDTASGVVSDLFVGLKTWRSVNTAPNWRIVTSTPVEYVNTLYREGWGNEGFCCIDCAFGKGEATKMYVDIEGIAHTNPYHLGNAQIYGALVKVIPENYSDCWDTFNDNAWKTTAFADLPPRSTLSRTQFEVSLDDVQGNFYIMFQMTGFQAAIIREISFDTPIIVKG